MNLPPQSQLTDAKYKEILSMINRLGVDLADVEEKFVKGGGRGGQKINKTSNNVQLKHLPTGTLVRYRGFRDRSMNRILALRELLYKLDPDSPKNHEAEKVRKQKKRRQKRHVAKFA
ncbi:peptide chain release factor-like protein [Candidatus Peregrinibacteria bacterium]|nr:peptide chain release factor-like protein [Candidatus Peregrinibacteria bacterium]